MSIFLTGRDQSVTYTTYICMCRRLILIFYDTFLEREKSFNFETLFLKDFSRKKAKDCKKSQTVWQILTLIFCNLLIIPWRSIFSTIVITPEIEVIIWHQSPASNDQTWKIGLPWPISLYKQVRFSSRSCGARVRFLC